MKKKKKQKKSTKKDCKKGKPKLEKKELSLEQLLKKYPYLNKKRNLKTRQDYIDIDEKFLRDLCKDEKAAEFYNQFCKEFYNADYRDQVFVKPNTKLKNELNKEHYSRRVCVFNILKSSGLLSTYKPEVLNKKEKDS